MPRAVVKVDAVDRVWIHTDAQGAPHNEGTCPRNEPGKWTTLYMARCETGTCPWESERDPSVTYVREQAAYHRAWHRQDGGAR